MRKLNKLGLSIFSIVMLAGIACLDILVDAQISVAFLYIAPVGLVTWRLGWHAGACILLVSLGSMAFIGYAFGTPYVSLKYFVVAMCCRAAFLGVIIALVQMLRKKEIERVHVPV